MSDYIPDPVERMEARIDRWASEYKEGHCQGCGKNVGEDCLDCGPLGDGPALCFDCYCPKTKPIGDT